jgi:toxin ParE1/3/4
LPSVFVHARARRDILDSATYLEDKGGPELAERFVAATRQTFEALALMPRMGLPCGFRKPSLRRLRRWPVKDFENWLIFYKTRREGLEIVHVWHGARDIASLFGEGK